MNLRIALEVILLLIMIFVLVMLWKIDHNMTIISEALEIDIINIIDITA